MVAPLIPLMFGAGQMASTINNARRMRENRQYWNDYQKNTGKTAKYPFRAGVSNDYGQLLSGAASTMYSASKIYGGKN